MNVQVNKVNLADKFATFNEHWSPKIVGEVDDFDVKIVKIEGDFVWHSHEEEDEMFLVLDGGFDMRFRDKTVHLDAGEMIVVPKGVEHMPSAPKECHVMIFERRGVVNTGNASPNELTAGTGERI